MSEKKILVIDDSATIRRLVDGELSSAGYRVLLAENAEKGIATATAESPDLILLDHQLPGTTGFEVCSKLLDDEALRGIPVVVSSTLRKKAYVEYTDCANVVDMLPKPYTGELLRTTVANALETAVMIVQSQSHGTAVPEVIHSLGDAALSGTLAEFSVRELIDFLNNGNKRGMLEFDCGNGRVSVFLDKGRIQAVTASGIDAKWVVEKLPASLADLAPMVKFTLSGRQNSQVDGLVELLNNKVLDARLLRQLLRHQAATLIHYCIENRPRTFQFDAQHVPPSLFEKLPLDVCLLALLVDASLLHAVPEEQDATESVVYSRQSIRGQNLDRAGLSSQHMKLLSLINNPISAQDLATRSGCPLDQTRQALRGFEWADLIQSQSGSAQLSVLMICSDASRARQLQQVLRGTGVPGKVVRDALALKLLLRRNAPSAIVVDLDDAAMVEVGRLVQKAIGKPSNAVKWLGVASDGAADESKLNVDGVLGWDEFETRLLSELDLPTQSSHRSAANQLANCP